MQAGRLLSSWTCASAPLRLVEGECQRKEAIDDSEKKEQQLNERVCYRDTENVDVGAERCPDVFKAFPQRPIPQCPLSSKRYAKGPLEGPTRTHGVALACGAHTLSV